MSVLEIRHLGLIGYEEAWQLQKELAIARSQQAIPDTLLLLEHPHTYTLGSAGKRAHLLMSERELATESVTVLQVDRGGDITYHGPGQLVGYPILQLPRRPGELHSDVVHYVRQLEEALILALAEFDIAGQRLAGFTGVWVEVGDHLAKIAAIGVKVTSKAVTQHGFALNLNPEMRFFQGIIPCGIPDKPVTSLAELLPGTAPTMSEVTASVAYAFGQVFQRDIRQG